MGMQGKPLSVFDGVPFAAKDNQDAMAFSTHAGTTFLAKQCAPMSAYLTTGCKVAPVAPSLNLHKCNSGSQLCMMSWTAHCYLDLKLITHAAVQCHATARQWQLSCA